MVQLKDEAGNKVKKKDYDFNSNMVQLKESYSDYASGYN